MNDYQQKLPEKYIVSQGRIIWRDGRYVLATISDEGVVIQPESRSDAILGCQLELLRDCKSRAIPTQVNNVTEAVVAITRNLTQRESQLKELVALA